MTQKEIIFRIISKKCCRKKFVDVVFVAEIDGRIAGYYTGKEVY